MYPKEKDKHARGEKLNKMAILTMYKALPKREFPDKQLEHKLRLV